MFDEPERMDTAREAIARERLEAIDSMIDALTHTRRRALRLASLSGRDDLGRRADMRSASDAAQRILTLQHKRDAIYEELEQGDF